jgi:hypothetical protein
VGNPQQAERQTGNSTGFSWDAVSVLMLPDTVNELETLKKVNLKDQAWWCTLVIPATQEAEVGGL